MFSRGLSHLYLLQTRFAIQIGDWDVSRVTNFFGLFVDYTGGNPTPGAETFNEPLNWDTGM